MLGFIVVSAVVVLAGWFKLATVWFGLLLLLFLCFFSAVFLRQHLALCFTFLVLSLVAFSEFMYYLLLSSPVAFAAEFRWRFAFIQFAGVVFLLRRSVLLCACFCVPGPCF